MKDCAEEHTRRSGVVLNNSPENPREYIDTAGSPDVKLQPADQAQRMTKGLPGSPGLTVVLSDK